MASRPKKSVLGHGLADVWASLGLTPSEIAAYIFLAESGPESASALSKATGQSRGRVYLVLRGLVERGFVREEPGTPTRFAAVAPRDVLQLAADAASRHAQELRSVASELPPPPPPTDGPREALAVKASILRGRRSIAAEALRILDRSTRRFYVAGAGHLLDRVRASDSFTRALRSKAQQGASVGVAPAELTQGSVSELAAQVQPALVAALANPEAFPINVLVGDAEALLVVVDPDDDSPARGEDYGVHLRGVPYADTFASWFERLALGGAPGEAAFAKPVEAQQALSEAVRSARREVAVMGGAGWLNLVFGAPSAQQAPHPIRPGVVLRVVAEADVSSWRTIKPLLVAWTVRMVRQTPEWVVVVDGTLTFTGIPGDERDQVVSVRHRRDEAEARHHLALFGEAWHTGSPVGVKKPIPPQRSGP